MTDPPRTVRELLTEFRLSTHCEWCNRTGELELGVNLKPHHGDLTLEQLRAKLWCSECKRKPNKVIVAPW